jgi:hypothetical protein
VLRLRAKARLLQTDGERLSGSARGETPEERQ